MPENLKKALEMMLFMSDQQVLWTECKKINFKKKDWFKEYTWTEKREEQYIQWLSDFLKKNWQGMIDTKPTSKKLRDKVSEEFVSNYGCVIRELNIKDFTPTVSWDHLDEVMSKRERESFNKWMFGQTTPLHGVYKWDLETYLAHRPNLD